MVDICYDASSMATHLLPGPCVLFLLPCLFFPFFLSFFLSFIPPSAKMGPDNFVSHAAHALNEEVFKPISDRLPVQFLKLTRAREASGFGEQYVQLLSWITGPCRQTRNSFGVLFSENKTKRQWWQNLLINLKHFSLTSVCFKQNLFIHCNHKFNK